MSELIGQSEMIDHDAVIQQLQYDLEKARLEILRLRWQRVYTIDMDAIRDWVQDNYILLAALFILVSLVVNIIKVIRGNNHER